MRKLVLAVAAVAALSFGASAALADHGWSGYSGHCDRHGHGAPHRSYYGYRGSPAYYSRYEVHRYVAPYHHHHHHYAPPCYDTYRYGYSPYGTSLGVHGSRISFSIGF